VSIVVATTTPGSAAVHHALALATAGVGVHCWLDVGPPDARSY
jgi:hypothetical protein